MGQLATPTDRILAFGRLRKLEDARPRASVLQLDIERTVVVRPRQAAHRSFVPAAVLAAMFGVASLIAIGVGTTHARALTFYQAP